MKEKNLFPFLIFLLNFSLIGLSTTNSFRNLNNYHSEIHLVIQGNGTQNILNTAFNPGPSKVLINGSKNNSCNKTCYLEGDKNNITLIFNEKIKSCNSFWPK